MPIHDPAQVRPVLQYEPPKSAAQKWLGVEGVSIIIALVASNFALLAIGQEYSLAPTQFQDVAAPIACVMSGIAGSVPLLVGCSTLRVSRRGLLAVLISIVNLGILQMTLHP